MSNIEIRINEEMLESGEGIACLIEAANDIFTATESDFNLIKSKKWYSRLWNVVTLSKENEKVLAKGTANLAKLQEIVMKALIILSNKNVEVASYVKENSDCIERLSKNQIIILNEIQNIKYGIEKNICLDDVNENKKYIILNILAKYAQENPGNDLSKEYILAIFRSQKFSQVNIQEIDNEKIEELKLKEITLLYHILMEYSYLAYDDFNKNSTIFHYIAISQKKINEIENKIISLSNIAGKRFFIDIYDKSNDIYLLNDNEIEFDYENEEIDYDNNEKIEEDVELEKRVLKDDTSQLYPEIRKLVKDYMPKVYEGFHYKQTKKKYENFIDASDIFINFNTIIHLLDTTIRGRGTAGILFTTGAFYYYEGSLTKRLITCRYHQIEDVSIKYIDKKTTTIKIFMTDGNIKTLTNPLGINLNSFMDLIGKIIELNKKSLIPKWDYNLVIQDHKPNAILSYFKILMNMMNQDEDCVLELYILLNEHEIEEYTRRKILKYYDNRNEDMYCNLVAFDKEVEYPSKYYARNLLIRDYIKLLYNQGKEHIGIKEQNSINILAKYYDISDSMVQKNILTRDKVYILCDELKEIDKEVAFYRLPDEYELKYEVSFDNDEVKIISSGNLLSKRERKTDNLTRIYKILCGIRKNVLEDEEYFGQEKWFIDLKNKINIMYDEFKSKIINEVNRW